MKEDHHSIYATFAVEKRKPENLQACTEFEPLTSAIPVIALRWSSLINNYNPSLRSSHIWFSYIHNFIIILSRVHNEPIQRPAPSWLISLIGRALSGITGCYVTFSFRTVVWVLLCSKKSEKWKCCETRPTAFRPYVITKATLSSQLFQ